MIIGYIRLQYIAIGYAQNCDPGPCAELPGLVYNAELEECAWPDEVGCSLGGNKNKVYRKFSFLKYPDYLLISLLYTLAR